MFGFRTPAKPSKEPDSQLQTEMPGQTQTSLVRRSIGEWEAGQPSQSPLMDTPPQKIAVAIDAPRKPKQAGTTSNGRKKSVDLTKSPQMANKFPNRTAEARACLHEAKTKLISARTLRTDIKNDVTIAIDRLYQLVKEAEIEKGRGEPVNKAEKQEEDSKTDKIKEKGKEGVMEGELILTRIEEQTKLLLEQQKKLEEIYEEMSRPKEENRTPINPSGKQAREPSALHTLVVSSKIEEETGDEVLERVRKAVDAREGWIRVEKVRKGKNRKVIMGCDSEEERKKVRARLETAAEHLVVEDVKNKDPLLILRDVLKVHTDDEVLKSLRNQNREIFDDLNEEEKRATIKYRRRARNPHNCHIVLTVSPIVWRRALEMRKLRIDLQRVIAEDQSPLVQCTRCLGYGHGKKLCKEPADLCSHCGGPHLRTECQDMLTGVIPVCINCTRAKMTNCGHNAFNSECKIRRRWDTVARASVAYC